MCRSDEAHDDHRVQDDRDADRLHAQPAIPGVHFHAVLSEIEVCGHGFAKEAVAPDGTPDGLHSDRHLLQFG
jgi:hypothetical protein